MPFVVSIECGAEEADLLLAEIASFAVTGVEEQATGGESRVRLIAHFDDAAEARACYTVLGQAAAFDALPGEPVDWSPHWQSQWEPFALGTRLFLVPVSAGEVVVPRDRVRIDMHPGQLFGGGDHPTTQLCLELLEQTLRASDVVLDVGTGTGILSQAAQVLGAGRVLACDIDAGAVHHVRLALPEVPVWQGGIEACRGGWASLVMANLPGGLLIDLVPDLLRLLNASRPGARLLLSGCFVDQIEAVEGALGPDVEKQWRTRGEWAAVLASLRPGVRVVTVQEGDLAAVAQTRRLFEEYWASFGFTPCFQNFGDEVASLPGAYQAPGGELLLALDTASGEAVGVIAYKRWDDKRCEAKRLYVSPVARGKGIGRLLLNEVAARARAAGYHSIVGDTMPVMQDALLLYERMGFRQTGPYGDTPTPGAIYLECVL